MCQETTLLWTCTLNKVEWIQHVYTLTGGVNTDIKVAGDRDLGLEMYKNTIEFSPKEYKHTAAVSCIEMTAIP